MNESWPTNGFGHDLEREGGERLIVDGLRFGWPLSFAP